MLSHVSVTCDVRRASESFDTFLIRASSQSVALTCALLRFRHCYRSSIFACVPHQEGMLRATIFTLFVFHPLSGAHSGKAPRAPNIDQKSTLY